MDTNFYDVVVCGSELGGFITAALLGRRGFRVLLLGHDGDRPSFEAGGHQLSRGPGLLPPLDSPAVARIFKELNHFQILRRRAATITPPFQVVLPGHRFDFAADPEALSREIAREFGADQTVIEATLARLTTVSRTLDPLLGSDLTLPPDTFWERREIARLESLLPPPGTDLLAPLPAGHPARAALTAPATLSGALGPGEVGMVGLARALEVARRGVHRLEGGYAAVRSVFLDKLETYAGEIREKVTPVEIVERRGKVTGLRVRPRDETIGCSHLVWSGPLAGLVALCGDKPPRKLREAAASLRPACYRYTLSLLLHADALPEGMGPRVYAIADPARPLLEENALAITVGEPSPRDPARLPLWVECLVPAPAVDAGPGYLGAVRRRVREQIARLIPFFGRHLVVLASPHDGLPPELPAGTGAAAPPSPVPPIPMQAVYSAAEPRGLDVIGAQHATGTRSLYVVGRENLPGLGTEGEFVSAWGLARLISGAQPKRDQLRREVLLGES